MGKSYKFSSDDDYYEDRKEKFNHRRKKRLEKVEKHFSEEPKIESKDDNADL